MFGEFKTADKPDRFTARQNVTSQVPGFRFWACRTQHGVRKRADELPAAVGATQYEIMCLMAHTEAKTSEI